MCFKFFKKSWRASSAHTYSVLVSLCGEPSYNKPCPSRRTWWIPAHLSGDMNPSAPPPPNPFALVILCSSKGAEATATCTVYNEHHLQDFLCALGGSAFLSWRQIPADLDLHPAAPLHPATVPVVLPQPQHSCWNQRQLSGDPTGQTGTSRCPALGSHCRSPCSSFPPPSIWTAALQEPQSRSRTAGTSDRS